jgi:hypothetical protein
MSTTSKRRTKQELQLLAEARIWPRVTWTEVWETLSFIPVEGMNRLTAGFRFVLNRRAISRWVLNTLAKHSNDALVHYLQGQNAELLVELDEASDEIESLRTKLCRVRL